MATLAIVIRLLAGAGSKIRINLSAKRKGRLTRIHEFLWRIGFMDLFSGDSQDEPWLANISWMGDRSDISLMNKTTEGFTEYIPLQWFSKDAFQIALEENIWTQKPRLSANYSRKFRSILEAQGFADSDLIDIICDTMFLELGWNTVIHSQTSPGTGIGTFCGQILRGERQDTKTYSASVRFCVADLGRGIPASLKSQYKAHEQHRPKVSEISTKAAILMYALEPASSSRPVYQSQADREGPRGLAQVAADLRSSGRMLIRSDGAAIALQGTVEGTNIVEEKHWEHYPIPGTQIIGTLIKEVRLAGVVLAEQDRRIPSFKIYRTCGFDGSCSVLRTERSTEEYVRDIKPTQQLALFDLGYGDLNAREIEYLCRILFQLHKTFQMVIWNVRTAWDQLRALEKIANNNCREGGFPILLVRGNGDARFLGSLSSPSMFVLGDGWRTGSTLDTWCAREAGVSAGESPVGAIRRFSTADRANCVAVRRGGEQAWDRTGRS